jgi:hypothetical protein
LTVATIVDMSSWRGADSLAPNPYAASQGCRSPLFWIRKPLFKPGVQLAPSPRFQPSQPLANFPRPRRPGRDHPEDLTHIGHTFRAKMCHSGVRMSVVGVWEENKKAPQASVFVGVVCRVCRSRVCMGQCRRGDLNPRPYANALDTSVTLTPHRLHMSMRYPSNLNMP